MLEYKLDTMNAALVSIAKSLEKIANPVMSVGITQVIPDDITPNINADLEHMKEKFNEPSPEKEEKLKKKKKKAVKNVTYKKPEKEKEVVATIEATPPTITKDDVMGVMRKNVKLLNGDKWLVQLMDGYNAPKLSDLKESDYSEFYNQVEAKNNE